MPTSDLPAGASASWWSAVQEDIRRQEYGVTWRSATYLPSVPAAYQAPNRAHSLRTDFLPEGVRIISRTRGQESWEFGLALSGLGSLANVQPLGAAELIPSANRMAYHRGSLFEQYINDERGVTQRFVVQVPPCCCGIPSVAWWRPRSCAAGRRNRCSDCRCRWRASLALPRFARC